MIGYEYITFLSFPSVNRVTTDPGIGKDIIDLHGGILHETVVGYADILGEIFHTGTVGNIDHFFAVGFRVHVANKDTGRIGEEGFFFHLFAL